jgi:hypothetical protein
MRLLILTFSVGIIFGCSHEDKLKQISSTGSPSESVYLTHDQHDNPVVVWTERNGDDLKLYFSVSHDNGKSFLKKVELDLTSDVATHAEGMPKVAFKNDGTIFAAYEKELPTESNKYAGAICYRTSSDNGKSWTPEAFLHSDTIAGRSRSFFDIERLPDGEIGASWLDIKLNVETGGRSVRFAKTRNSGDFGNEVLVDSSACQCCRIDVYSDMTQRINIAYRGLMKGKMGQQIRDMMIATSADGGDSFTSPQRISADNWVIDGCPHTGPSLCSSKGGLYSLWYTGGNGTGIYYSFKPDGNNAFGKRELLSGSGRHPQLSANETRSIMVWEEYLGESDKKFTRILYQIGTDTGVTRDILTPTKNNSFSPVVTQTKDGFLVAFLMETSHGLSIYTTKL